MVLKFRVKRGKLEQKSKIDVLPFFVGILKEKKRQRLRAIYFTLPPFLLPPLKEKRTHS